MRGRRGKLVLRTGFALGALAIALTLLLLRAAPQRPSTVPGAPAPAVAQRADDGQSEAPEAVAPPPAASAQAQAPPAAGQYVPQQLLVKFKAGTAEATINARVSALGASIVRTYRAPGLRLIALPEGLSVPDARRRFSELPEVETAEPNYARHILAVPNDPDFHLLWGLHNTQKDFFGRFGLDIGALDAWDNTTGSSGVYIGVIDTGIDYEHQDLKANVWTNPNEIAGNGIDDDGDGWVDDVHGLDLVDNDADPADENGHGTHVAGTIAARGNNGIGVVGVMWQASLISCRAFDKDGFGFDSALIECVEYFEALKDSGINVVATNNSYGGGAFSQIFYDAIERSGLRDILFVAAAGNNALSNDSDPMYPASFDLDTIIAVAALSPDGFLADFSNTGPESVDIAAPGEGIYSTLPGDQYGYYSGTSMATPHVTGIVGLTATKFPGMSAHDRKAWILSHAVFDPVFEGILTSARAVAVIPIRDEDHDNMDDDWELANGLNPANSADAPLDPDGDGLANLGEYLAKSNPRVADTDSDGLNDGAEVNTYHSDPRLADTDGDGLSDAVEVNTQHTNPTLADTDADGLADGAELTATTNPLVADTDGDTMADGFELTYQLNPKSAADRNLDPDGDGLTNAQEFAAGSNPRSVDSDGDGLTDFAEVRTYATNPASADTDSDTLPDKWEITYGLNPNNAADAALDPDHDDYSSAAEFRVGTNPIDGGSYPALPAWGARRGGPAHNAVIPVDSRPARITKRWTREFSTLSFDPQLAAANDKIFQSDIPEYGVSAITARSVADGATLWRKDFASPSTVGAPSAAAGAVYTLVHDSVAQAEVLYRLAAPDGAVQFTHTIDLPYVAPSLVPHNDRVFAYGRDANAQGVVLAFDANTGNEVWRRATGIGDMANRAVAVNDRFVVDYSQTTLSVLDRATGAIVFQDSTASCYDDYSNVVFDARGNLYVHTSFCIMKYDLTARRLVWERIVPGGLQSLAVDDKYLYTHNYLSTSAFDPADGSDVWQWWTPQPKWPRTLLHQALVVTLTQVFVSADDATYALDRLTGKPVWKYDLGGSLFTTADGALILLALEGGRIGMVALNLTGDRDSDGAPDWWEDLNGFNKSSSADATGDADGDGMPNLAEFTAGTNPRNADTDGDGFRDGAELAAGADPRRADTDRDGLSDGSEVSTYGTSPTLVDSDLDGYTDAEEVEYATNGANASSRPQFLGSYTESFEGVAPAGWRTGAGAAAGFTIAADSATSGTHSLKADPVDYPNLGAVEWSGSFLPGQLTFDARVSAAACCMYLRLLVDGAEQFAVTSGTWAKYSVRMARGRHVIRWELDRRSAPSPAETAWIDNVEFRATPEFGSDARHILVSAQNRLQEFTTDGASVGQPVAIPGATDAGDLVMLRDHRVAIVDAPSLHIYDPVFDRFYSTSFEGFSNPTLLGSGKITATDDYLVANNPGALHGVRRFDRYGAFVDHQLIGHQYRDLTRGGDGFLYGLVFDVGLVEKIDPVTFAVVSTIQLSRGFGWSLAVSAAGELYLADSAPCSSGCAYTVTKYSAAGQVLAILSPPSGADGGAGTSIVDMALIGDLLAAGTRYSSVVEWARTNFTKYGTITLGGATATSFVAPVEKQGVDSDGDGMPDWWERVHGFDAGRANDAAVDADGDGLTNLREYQLDTEPRGVDSDGDGIPDADEVTRGTAPLNTDSDDDGIGDGVEINQIGTSPLIADTDGDGLGDGAEVNVYHTDPRNADTDGDGASDGWEVAHGFDPRTAADAQQDTDGDGLTNAEERAAGTDPRAQDTDLDGLTDSYELRTSHTDPLRRDTDGDRIWDDWEVANALDPRNAADAKLDTDGDGFDNRTEYFADTNPRDARSFPVAGPWVTFQGNAAHTGYVPLRLVPSEFAPYWRTDLIPRNALDLQQVVSDSGVVFVNTAPRAYNATLAALDAVTGARLWQTDVGVVETIGPPALAGDEIVMQKGDPQMLWYDRAGVFKRAGPTEPAYLHALVAPTPYAGHVYALSGGFGVGAYDSHDGRRLWFRGTAPYTAWTPAVDRDSVYVFLYNWGWPYVSQLHRFYRDTGIRRPSVIDPHPAPVGANEIYTAPALGRNHDLLAVQSNRLLKVDLLSNRVAWDSVADFSGTPTLANGVVYAVDGGDLVALTEDDGRELWRWSAPGHIDHPALATVDHVFVSTLTTTYAIDVSTGQQVWSYPRGGALSLGNERVLFIAGTDGDLQAIALFADADHDGMADAWERRVGLNPANAADARGDADGDGVTNLMEFWRQTDPRVRDSDGDGLDDGVEIATRKTDPLRADTDLDGLSDGAEVAIHGTNPLVADGDGDGLDDGVEVNARHTNPLVADTDGDGVNDLYEVKLGSDPRSASSKPVPVGTIVESFESGRVPGNWDNGKGGTTGWEVVARSGTHGSFQLESMSTEPDETAAIEWTAYFLSGEIAFDSRVIDSSYDGDSHFYVDGAEQAFASSGNWQTLHASLSEGVHVLRWEFTPVPQSLSDQRYAAIDYVRVIAADGDADGMPDAWELAHGLDPRSAADRTLDLDGDGLTNFEEFGRGTLPDNRDTDGDGMPDGWEVTYRFNPTSMADAATDADGDGVSNVAEYRAGTDPRAAPPTTPPPTTPPPTTPPPASGGGGGGGGGAFDPVLLLVLAACWFWRRRPLLA